MDPFLFEFYDDVPKTATLTNNGHTVQMGFEMFAGQSVPVVSVCVTLRLVIFSPNTFDIFFQVSSGGLPGKYQFAQFHFHWGSSDAVGSEHTIDNVSIFYPTGSLKLFPTFCRLIPLSITVRSSGPDSCQANWAGWAFPGARIA